MNKTIRSIALLLAILTVGALFFYLRLRERIKLPKKMETEYVKIPTNSTFDEVVGILAEDRIIKDEALFRRLANYMEYPRNPMRAGRFKIEKGWTMIDLIRHLRGGKQAPVDLVLHNERLIENVAGKAARFIEPDSLDLLNQLRDDTLLDTIGYSDETLMALFIPNTYEFFWNTSPAAFVERMRREHTAFWSENDRRNKASNLGMTTKEVYTLASIVEKETLKNSEKPRMAGVYLNRLGRGMRLQADPTAVFARRDFGAKRVTDYHTKFDSPYNTYLYTGLPPGPISMASIASIDAVLNAENHDYFYFCAKGDGSGLHAFAKTLAQHNRNAARYRQNLRDRGLR